MATTMNYGKQLTKYSRAVQYLEKLFDLCNEYWFNNELETPVITIQSTPRAYGHYTLFDAWEVNGESRREINIGAGTLERPIENICCTLLHEMVHEYNNEIANISDVSNNGVYHNKYFKQEAERRGLIVTRSEKYGWSCTEPSDALLDFVLEYNLQDIKLNRNERPNYIKPNGGASTGTNYGGASTRKGHSIRYVCPQCKTIVRATKHVNIGCLDCMIPLVES